VVVERDELTAVNSRFRTTKQQQQEKRAQSNCERLIINSNNLSDRFGGSFLVSKPDPTPFNWITLPIASGPSGV
jgi:hypothetical protein